MKINKALIVSHIAATHKINKKQVETILTELYTLIQNALLNGDSVALTGIGTITPTTIATRPRYDINTKGVTQCTATTTVKLDISEQLKVRLNPTSSSGMDLVELAQHITF